MLLVIITGFKRGEMQKDLAYLRTFPRAQRNQTIALTLIGGALLTVNWLTFIYIVNNINIKTASLHTYLPRDHRRARLCADP